MWPQLLLLVFLIVATTTVSIFRVPDDELTTDPEVYMNATQLITSKGYPCENHWATTEDGYILNLVRIPHGRHNARNAAESKPAVFLQHGIFTSATNFLTNEADQSLAYILADAGADVWLGNSRGNIYSRNHTTLSPKDHKFWDYGWDEMAKYDVPANVNYIRNVTGQDKIIYGGHSQGTTIAFAEFSENQELASHIKHFIALAPVARVWHAETPLVKLAPFAKFGDLFHHGAITFSQSIKDFLAAGICPKVEFLCENALFLFCGDDTKNLNKSRIPIYLSHNPAGASARDVLQFAQNVNAKQFQKYDYGSEKKNMEHYGQKTPPLYDLSKMKVPVAMFTGTQDWLADPKDVAWLLPQLNVTHHVNIDYYNHLDFIWAIDAPQVIYKDIIKIVMS